MSYEANMSFAPGDEPVAHARASREPDSVSSNPREPANVFWHSSNVAWEERARLYGHEPLTLWLTGLSGAGKSTIAYELERLLLREKQPCAVLDGDNLRHRLNRDLGFSAADRRENVRRTAEVARLMNEAGLVVIVSLVSPYRDDRDAAKEVVGEDRFIEVYVSTSLEVCESRDPKGLYRRARRGEIEQFTGVSAPYEPPVAPALAVDTAVLPTGAAAARLHAYLKARSAGADCGVAR